MARILIVGGGCRALWLAPQLTHAGDAVRITTRTAGHRDAIEQAGAECWLGTPERLATMRGVLDGVAIAVWALGSAQGSNAELAALHGDRLRAFLTQAIDSTVRGFVYETRGNMQDLIDAGARIASDLCAANSIPLELMDADPRDPARWASGAHTAINVLLAAR